MTDHNAVEKIDMNLKIAFLQILPGTPGVYAVELDLDRLRTHRNNDIMGDKYRRPDRYGILSDEKVRGVIGGGFVIGKG